MPLEKPLGLIIKSETLQRAKSSLQLAVISSTALLSPKVCLAYDFSEANLIIDPVNLRVLSLQRQLSEEYRSSLYTEIESAYSYLKNTNYRLVPEAFAQSSPSPYPSPYPFNSNSTPTPPESSPDSCVDYTTVASCVLDDANAFDAVTACNDAAEATLTEYLNNGGNPLIPPCYCINTPSDPLCNPTTAPAFMTAGAVASLTSESTPSPSPDFNPSPGPGPSVVSPGPGPSVVSPSPGPSVVSPSPGPSVVSPGPGPDTYPGPSPYYPVNPDTYPSPASPSPTTPGPSPYYPVNPDTYPSPASPSPTTPGPSPYYPVNPDTYPSPTYPGPSPYYSVNPDTYPSPASPGPGPGPSPFLIDWPPDPSPSPCIECVSVTVPAVPTPTYETCLTAVLTGISIVQYASCVPAQMTYGECTQFESALDADPAVVAAMAAAAAAEAAAQAICNPSPPPPSPGPSPSTWPSPPPPSPGPSPSTWPSPPPPSPGPSPSTWPSPSPCIECISVTVPALPNPTYETCLAAVLTAISMVQYASCVPEQMTYGDCIPFEPALDADPAVIAALAAAAAAEAAAAAACNPYPSPAGPSPFGPSPYGPSPYGPSPYGPSPYGPSPYGPSPYGPSPYGPSPYGPSPYGPSPYGPSPYGPSPYGPSPYGPSPYGPSPYGPSPYGPNPFPYPTPYPNPDVCYDQSYDTPPINFTGSRDESLPFIPAHRQDDRYRDLCVSSYSGAALMLDPQTGENNNTPPMKYLAAGRYSGSKAPPGTCIPLKNTPIVSTQINDPDLAFRYALNIDDRFDYTNLTTSYKNAANGYLKTNVVYSPLSKHFCSPMVEMASPLPLLRSNIIPYARFRQDQVQNCYDQYIMSRVLQPWFFWEPQGSPLERYMKNNPDMPTSSTNKIIVSPKRIILDHCQPLIDGNVSIETPIGSPQELEAGFSPVQLGVGIREGAIYVDESEYLFSDKIRDAWQQTLTNPGRYLPRQIGVNYHPKPVPFIPPIGLPCTIPATFNAGVVTYPWRIPGEHVVVPCDAPPDNAPDQANDPPACAPPYMPMPPDFTYFSGGKLENYCPNVEKITDPRHPFSPRFESGGNDRSYSSMTSTIVGYPEEPRCKCATETRMGYTDYNDYPLNSADCVPFNPNGAVHREKVFGGGDKTLNPEIMCAVVPVDIMSWRANAFHTCITQRIAYNFNTWVDEGMPTPSHGHNRYGGHRGGFNPPCATRWYQTDTFEECPVRETIQRCCTIILKDVVPMNFLKMRTCDGLEMSRRDNKVLPAEWLKHPVDIGNIADPVPQQLGAGTYTPTFLEGFKQFFDARFSNRYDQEIAIEWMNKLTFCDNAEPMGYRYVNYFPPYTAPGNPPHPEGAPPDKHSFLGSHKPYLRWWDTGVSAGMTRKNGSYVNVLSTFDVIVGVGREERNKWDTEKDEHFKPYLDRQINAADNALASATEAFDKELLKWLKQLLQSDKGRLKALQFREAGNIGDWTELLGNQAWGNRLHNFECIGRHEKLFKDGDAESRALTGGSTGFSSSKLDQMSWPLGWRGYGTDLMGGRQFADFRGNPGSASGGNYRGDIFKTGLDDAEPGDIIVLDTNDSRLVPHTAYVMAVDFAYKKYIRVIEWNYGKFPTATGVTNQWGQGEERWIWKDLPLVSDDDLGNAQGQNKFAAIVQINGKHLPSCLDTDYTHCTMKKADWDQVKIYHRSADVHQCPGTLSQTYLDDRDSCVNNIVDTSGNVIYQADVMRLSGNRPKVPSTGGNVNVPPSMISTIANCINQGADPPPVWLPYCGLGRYAGAGTGAITKTSFCPPQGWGSCRAAPYEDPPNSGNWFVTKPSEVGGRGP